MNMYEEIDAETQALLLDTLPIRTMEDKQKFDRGLSCRRNLMTGTAVHVFEKS